MKLSIFCPVGLKTPIDAPKIVFWGEISPPKWGAMSTKPPRGTSAGRNSSSGVLIYYVSICNKLIVPEKSRRNKKCDKEEEQEKLHILDFLASL